MEVFVTGSIGLPDDAVVSVRFGTTRRQAPLDTVSAHPLKFPSSLDSICEPLKIDILQPIATTRLVLFPHAEQYQIGFEHSGDMELGLNIKPSTGADRQGLSSRPGSAMPIKFQDAAASAKEYLEGHGLLRYVQSMLHAVIQVKPEDPYAFMIEQLSTAQSKSKTVRSRPSSAMPGGRSLSRPASAVLAGCVPVPPSSTPLHVSGEQARLPGRGGCLPNEADSQVFRDQPLEKPVPSQSETLRPHEVPELSNDGLLLEKTALPQHKMPELSKEEDAQVSRQQLSLSDKPVPPQLEALKLQNVPEPVVPPPQLPPSAEEEHLVLSPSLASPQLEAKASLTAAGIAPAASPEATEQAGADIEDQRLRMRSLHEHAYSSGKLTEAVDTAIASGREIQEKSNLDDGLDDMKFKMRKLMEDGANSGQLEEAIKNTVLNDASKREKATEAPEPAQASGDLEVIKAKLQSLLTAAADSGELEEAIDRISTQRTTEEMQMLKGQILDILESATASGELVQVLEAVSPKSASATRPKADLELDEVKAKLRNLMQEAIASGELDEAFQGGVDKETGQPSLAQNGLDNMAKSAAGHDLDRLKDRLRGILTEACVSGSLDNILGTVTAPKQVASKNGPISAVAGQPMSAEVAIKQAAVATPEEIMSGDSPQAEVALSPAVAEVRTHVATAELVVKPAVPEPAVTKAAAKTAQSNTTQEMAKPETKASPEVAAAKAAGRHPDAADLNDIKVKLRGLMQNASESGKLVEALATISPKQKITENGKDGVASEAGLDEIKCKLRQLMQEAQESGKLTQALGTIIETKEQATTKSHAGTVQEQRGLDVKSKLRVLVQEACESGKLAEALGKVASLKECSLFASTSLPREELDAVKAKLRGLMQEATESGKLRDAFGNIADRKQDENQPAVMPDTQEMATIKAKPREVMTEATESGQLAQTLANISDGSEGRGDVAAPSVDFTSPLDVDELKDNLTAVKQESQTLHCTVDQMQMEMEALRQRNEELSRRLAAAEGNQ